MTERKTRAGVVHIEAHCDACDFAQYARNAQGLAAQHHDKTGHTVRVEKVTHITYGDE